MPKRLTFSCKLGDDSNQPFYFVYNKNSEVLGYIEYYPPWHKWVWNQRQKVVMSTGCLQEVIDFIKKEAKL